MTQGSKTKKERVAVPATFEECNRLIGEIGVRQRMVATLTATRDEKMAAIKSEYDGHIARYETETDGLVDAVQEFCEAHRDELTDGGKRKTFRFPAGEVAWRNRPPSVTIRKVQAVIEFCLADRKLLKFLRTKHKVNKDALRDDPETAATIPGVKIGSAGEDFFVEPFEPKPADRPAQAAE